VKDDERFWKGYKHDQYDDSFGNGIERRTLRTEKERVGIYS